MIKSNLHVKLKVNKTENDSRSITLEKDAINLPVINDSIEESKQINGNKADKFTSDIDLSCNNNNKVPVIQKDNVFKKRIICVLWLWNSLFVNVYILYCISTNFFR